MRKLTLSDAIRIRVEAKRGRPQTELAEEYGITKSNVTAIVQRRSHNHRLAERMKANIVGKGKS